MDGLYEKIRPLLFRLDPETAHNLTIKILKTGLYPRPQPPSATDPALSVRLWDKIFPNPLGLAAGFDKNAEVIKPMLGFGFGFIEVGTVTPKPQHGNPRPRIFRAPVYEAVINRMGFPNKGMLAFKDNLGRFFEDDPPHNAIIGINIGMNKSQKNPAKDYRVLVRQLGPMADYLTINISSPNTPGLRDLQKREPLLDLLGHIKDERDKSCGLVPPPLLLKLAPDLDMAQQEELAAAVMEAEIDGLILTNTTLSRIKGLPRDFANEKGGLSGKPLRPLSTEIIRNFYRLTDGALPIIGLGGIASAADAYEKIRAGACLVQLYSALVYHGPDVVKEITKGLKELLEKDGFATITEAVGADHKQEKQQSRPKGHSGQTK